MLPSMSKKNHLDTGARGGDLRYIYQEQAERCPAGTRSIVAMAEGPPKAFYSGMDAGRLAAPPPFTEACLTDLAQAAEQARIEERKARKRHMDAIYARRRRVREKSEESDLQQDAQDIRQVNQKLKEDNKKLEALLSDASSKIEGLGDADVEWLRDLQARERTRIEESAAVEWNPKSASTVKQKPKPAKLPPKDPPPKAMYDGKKSKPPSKVGDLQGKLSSAADDPSSSITEGTRNQAAAASLERQNGGRLDGGPSLGLLAGPSSLLHTEDGAIQAILQQSYLQGLNDAALLSQQQLQRDSAMLTAAAQQRELDQLLSSLHAASNARRNAPSTADYASLLAAANRSNTPTDPTSLYHLASRWTAPPPPAAAEALNFQTPAETALATWQNLQKLSAAPSAVALATQGVSNPLQLQMQLGILAAYERMFPPWGAPPESNRPPDGGGGG